MKSISPRREKIEAGSGLTKYHHHHCPASLSPLHPPVAGHPRHQHQVTILTIEMNTSGKGLVALYLHRRGEQWMVQQIKVKIKLIITITLYLIQYYEHPVS